MTKKKVSKFNSEYVKLLKIEVSNQMIKFTSSLDKESLIMALGKKINYYFDKKMSKVILFFDLFLGEESPENLTATFHIDYHFHIENIGDCYFQEEEQITVDHMMTSHLLAIAYSTSRGIIYEKLIATPYQNTILPIINPYDFLKE